MKVASYEDAWLRENDQTHRPGWVQTFVLPCASFFTFNFNSKCNCSPSDIRVVGIAHAQTRWRFRAQNDRKSQDFFLRNKFPVVSWGFYIHFRKETRIFIKMWLSTSTSFLGVPYIRISSKARGYFGAVLVFGGSKKNLPPPPLAHANQETTTMKKF